MEDCAIILKDFMLKNSMPKISTVLICFHIFINLGISQTYSLISVSDFKPKAWNLPSNCHSIKKDLLEISYPAPLLYFGITRNSISYINKLTLDTEEEIQEHAGKFTHADDLMQFSPTVLWIGLSVTKSPSENNWKKQALLLSGSYALMGLSVSIIKNNTHVLRPDRSNSFSFPSGHTATAFAGAEFIYREYRRNSIWYGIGAYTIAGATGFLRMYNNKHWLTDVVTGAGIGILSTKIIYLIHDQCCNSRNKHSIKVKI